ncbi:hypothetical protein CYMTET_37786 [Cymbomonas tetramitiformis]|uniref:tRNA pseudouridine synthase n=1 Tax=Cymbomonas tetramitiformis TaxID=36881 RepID=A0AAE0CD66_9CHLO|nr:hypothetical protein CYMTET_37786 [Cymbomonas tetramitiformis]
MSTAEEADPPNQVGGTGDAAREAPESAPPDVSPKPDAAFAPYWSKRLAHVMLHEGRAWDDVRAFFKSVVAGLASLDDLRPEWRTASDQSEPCTASATEKYPTPGTKADFERKRRTYCIEIAYFGEAFIGWQKQKGLRTVQGTLEAALQPLVGGCGRAASVVCSGRTDKGVSASSQVGVFYAWTDLDEADVLARLNAAGGPEQAIRVCAVQRVARSFHPCYHATQRRYVYVLPLRKEEGQQCTQVGECHVFLRDHLHPSKFDGICVGVNVAAVNSLLQQLEGRMLDYRAFARVPEVEPVESTECRLSVARAGLALLPSFRESASGHRAGGEVMMVELIGNRFIRKLVRILVATAIREAAWAGQPGWHEGLLVDLLHVKDNRVSSAPAPATGLVLAGVSYDGISATSLEQSEPQELTTGGE